MEGGFNQAPWGRLDDGHPLVIFTKTQSGAVDGGMARLVRSSINFSGGWHARHLSLGG